jgi:hypothetical protein
MDNNNPEFMGSWDPATGTFPIVPTEINTAYYLVTGPGVISGKSFAEGDWLIYTEDATQGPDRGSWYRTSGGIIQLASITQQASFNASDITDFSAAVNAAILLDGSTITKDPDTGALHVIVDGPITNNIESNNTLFVPPHKHVSVDISDFVRAVRESLGPTTLASNKPFFSNTALSNAVIFSYDNTLHSVSADVKIDNETIVKNKYGQLVAGKPAPMNITDILGLSEYLNNYVSQFADATEAPLHDSASLNGPWLPAGVNNFTGVKISDAFYSLNVNIKNLQDFSATLAEKVDSVVSVVPPQFLNPSIIPILSPAITFHEAYKAGTNEIIGVTSDTTPYSLSTAPFFKGLTTGTLTAKIDNVVTGRITLDPDTNQSGVQSGALTITEDKDSYSEEPAFHGLFKSIRARISPINNLPAGRHTFVLQEEFEAVGALSSGTMIADIDIPSTSMEIRSDAYLSTELIPYFISGVPSLNPTILYTLAPLVAEGVVGYTYGKYIANVTGHNTLIDNPSDLSANAIPPAPDYAHGAYGPAVSKPLDFHILDTYNEDVALGLRPYNSAGILGPEFVLHLGRIDSTMETNRVFSDDPSTLYPTTYGANWDPSKSLVTAPYLGELQKINHEYQWPKGTYAGGPDYSAAQGISIISPQTLSGTWRWLTLKLATGVVGRVAFTLSFLEGNTDSWACNKYTRETEGIMIYAKLGNSGWVDCNKPYKGIGTADTDGAWAADIGGHNGHETSASVKRVTLGPSGINNAAGDLFVRVALPYGSTKKFSDIIVSDWA